MQSSYLQRNQAERGKRLQELDSIHTCGNSAAPQQTPSIRGQNNLEKAVAFNMTKMPEMCQHGTASNATI